MEGGDEVSLLGRLLRWSRMSKEARGQYASVAYSSLGADPLPAVDLEVGVDRRCGCGRGS